MPNPEKTTDEKVTEMLGMLIKMQENVNKLETESAEVRSLLSNKEASANEKGETQKPNPDGDAAGGANSNVILEEEEKVMVDQEAMDIMERLYSADTETEIDEATGEPARVFIDDNVNFDTVGFPIVIKSEIMTKRKGNNTHNGKVNKAEVFASKQMLVRDNWDISAVKAREWESRFERISKEKHTSEVADEMKRLRKNLEDKDDMEDKLRGAWMELKAAARDLPAGRTEKDGVARWADRYSLKQSNEYSDKKSNILQNIRKWEKKSSIIIDHTKDAGRIPD